jgi:hypothetical protein
MATTHQLTLPEPTIHLRISPALYSKVSGSELRGA